MRITEQSNSHKANPDDQSTAQCDERVCDKE
jgi:hypothetical protein